MIRKHTWMALATVVVVGLLSTLVASRAEAGRGSVRHGSRERAGDPRGAADPRGVADPRGPADPRGVADPRGRYDPRGPYDPRGGYRAGYRAGYRHGHWHAWEDARRDYRRWRAFTGLVRLGVYYASRPKYSTAVVVTGTTYYYAGGVYYVQSGTGYVVTAAPPGAVVYAVPTYTTVVYVGTTPYYYANGVYYVQTDAPAEQPPPQATASVTASTDSSDNEHAGVESVEMTDDDENYEVVASPVGATVPYLPDEAEEESLGGKTYFVYADAWYKPFVSDGETIYMVVDDPREA